MLHVLEGLLEAVREEVADFRVLSLRQKNWARPSVHAPVEILRRIFEMASAPSAGLYPGSPLKEDSNWNLSLHESRQTRLSISSVCSRWKDIALEDHALWAHFIADREELLFEPLSVDLARSDSHPLYSHLAVGFFEKHNRTRVFHRLQDTLCSRTTHLNLWGTCQSSSPLFGDIPLFRNLQGLRVCLVVQNRPTQEAISLDLTPMQHLRELIVDIDDYRAPNQPRMWVQPPQSCGITRLVLVCTMYDGHNNMSPLCVALINACPYLETLDWASWADAADDDLVLNIDSQQHLTKLSITGDLPFSLLPHMHYPNLLSLRLHDEFEDQEDTRNPLVTSLIHEFFSMVTKFPKLRHLDQQVCVHSSHVIPFLHAHPDIEELVLWTNMDAAWTEGLASLAPSPSSDCTFNLQSLTRVWTNQCDVCYPDAIYYEDAAPCEGAAVAPVKELLRRRALYPSTCRPFTIYLAPRYHGPDPCELAGVYSNHVSVKQGLYTNRIWHCYYYG